MINAVGPVMKDMSRKGVALTTVHAVGDGDSHLQPLRNHFDANIDVSPSHPRKDESREKKVLTSLQTRPPKL